MGTTKPQFNCYLDRTVNDEINEHLAKTGKVKGHFVEQMWRMWQLRDLKTLYERLAAHFTRPLSPEERAWAGQVISLLQRALREEK